MKGQTFSVAVIFSISSLSSLTKSKHNEKILPYE